MDILSSIVVSVVTSVITATLGYYLAKKLEFKRMYREQKFKEESDRREFLVTWIKDETIPISSRIEAAREYLEKGYNGSMKKYIYEKGLFDNSGK
ncbi:MAG: hypothetical protein Ta2D_05870 [Rickettsiales bacterium]|nr:MAG: hypothetical protein Ta2D_05870 [Rickettsiales bacterium]